MHQLWSPLAVITCQAEDMGFDRIAVQRNQGVCDANMGPAEPPDGSLEKYTQTFCVPYVSSCILVGCLLKCVYLKF